MERAVKNLHYKYFDIILVLLFAILGFSTIYPFWNLLVISLNDPLDGMKGNLYFWPRVFSTLSYVNIFKHNDTLTTGAINSVIRTVAGTVLNVACTTLVAYALSRKHFVLRKFMTKYVVFTMYISAGLIPVYLLYKDLLLINNFAVYLVPHLLSAYNIIIIRTYIEQLPPSLSEAAAIDGAGDRQTLMKIIIPMSMPVIATISLFIAVWQWGQWQDTFFFASRRPKLTTLQYEMVKIISQSTSKLTEAQLRDRSNSSTAVVTPESLKAAMVIIATVPILIVYPFLQKYFVNGVTLGAIKE